MRLNQFIAESGRCSRREADRLIESGQVTVGGVKAVLGQTVGESDEVLVCGEPVRKADERVFILVYKPAGVTSSADMSEKESVVRYVGYPKRLFMVGRLDKDSEGALLLTNDGTVVNALLRSENGHEKTYRVKVDKTPTKDFLMKMSSGVEIYNPVADKNVITKPCTVNQIGGKEIEVILTQGYNRQIRRMCRALGYGVVSLRRTKFLFLTLDGLERGKWRKLTAAEVAEVDALCAASARK